MPYGMREVFSNSLMQLYAAFWKAKTHQRVLDGLSMIPLQKYVSVLGSTTTGVLAFEPLCHSVDIIGLWVYTFNHRTLLLEATGL